MFAIENASEYQGQQGQHRGHVDAQLFADEQDQRASENDQKNELLEVDGESLAGLWIRASKVTHRGVGAATWHRPNGQSVAIRIAFCTPMEFGFREAIRLCTASEEANVFNAEAQSPQRVAAI
ncbi:MAG: hypothetical protein ACT4NL_11180 [Pseudomarimonas sp.]